MTDARHNWMMNLVLAGGAIVCGAALILGYQGLLWLRDGEWTAVTPVRIWPLLFDYIYKWEWRGAQKIAMSVLDAPLSLLVFVAGIGIGWLGIMVGSERH